MRVFFGVPMPRYLPVFSSRFFLKPSYCGLHRLLIPFDAARWSPTGPAPQQSKAPKKSIGHIRWNVCGWRIAAEKRKAMLIITARGKVIVSISFHRKHCIEIICAFCFLLSNKILEGFKGGCFLNVSFYQLRVSSCFQRSFKIFSIS